MWSSSAGNNSCSSKAVSSSLSKSSTCSSPPPFSTSSPIATTPAFTRKSMEEVWKDITLSSLPYHPTTIIAAAATSANQHAFHGMILQDFLSHPSHKDPATGVDFDHVPSSARGGRATVFGSSVPPSATNLTLNLGSEFHYLQSTDPIWSNPQLQTHADVGTPSFVIPSFSKKRSPENDHDSRDRRHKRMIKNRESAARSRARRQAYTNELEDEVAHLVEENARLRRQLEKKSSFAAPLAQLPRKKNRVYRTLTAPF